MKKRRRGVGTVRGQEVADEDVGVRTSGEKDTWQTQDRRTDEVEDMTESGLTDGDCLARDRWRGALTYRQTTALGESSVREAINFKNYKDKIEY